MYLPIYSFYRQRYGRDVARKVPAHMPHLIDRAVMAELQADPFFAEHWAATSARRFRAGSDMQYAFAYYLHVYYRHKARYPFLSKESIHTLATELHIGAVYN